MSNRTRNIVWSPQKSFNRFIIGSSTDLRLYEYNEHNDSVNVIAVNSDVSMMKCFAWSPSLEYNDLLAMGLVNGRISLVRMLGTQTSEMPSTVGDMIPRHSRACNTVSFSKLETNLLAAGLDKVRNDGSLLVWDIQRAQSPKSDPQRPVTQFGTSEAVSSVSWLPRRPGLLCAGMGYKWLRVYDMRSGEQSPALVVPTKAVYGLNVDFHNDYRFASFSDEGIISIWDMRKFMEPILKLSQEGVNQISFCADQGNQLASISKDTQVVKLWNFTYGPSVNVKEINVQTSTGSLEPPSSVLSSAFAGMNLGASSQESLMEKSNASWLAEIADFEPTLLWRVRSINHKESIASFCWSTGTRNRLAIVGRSGNVEFRHVPQVPVISQLSPNNFISTCFNENPFHVNSVDIYSQDINHQMHDLAKKGYSADTKLNLSLLQLPQFSEILSCWRYIDRVEQMRQMGTNIALRRDYSFENLETIIADWANLLRNLAILNDSTTTDEIKISTETADVAEMEQIVLNTCGISKQDFHADHLIETLVNKNQTSKAAMFAVFSGDIELSVRLLNTIGTEGMKFVATILAGMGNFRNLSFDFCTLCKSISEDCGKENSFDLNIKAIFLFLSASCNLDVIIYSEEFDINDRLLIAIIFLKEHEKLRTFIRNVSKKFIAVGDLRGLMFIGFSYPFAINLFQNYVDRTGDIQTVALCFSYCTRHFLSLYPPQAIDQIKLWIESYRDLLDQWEMFSRRCEFDIKRRELFFAETQTPSFPPSPGIKGIQTNINNNSPTLMDLNHNYHLFQTLYEIPSQVFVRCNYCNQSIGNQLYASPILASKLGSGDRPYSTNSNNSFNSPTILSHPSQRVKPMACASCKKPLPRCSICLLYMETSPASCGLDYCEEGIDSWFTWCQKCKHGGHYKHLSQWFALHNVCPVSGCSCNCNIK